MPDVVISPPLPTYRDFIKEAFLDPIRTAVIIDDEYPTLDELLLDPIEAKEDASFDPERNLRKSENKPRVREILKFCRMQRPTPWLVDVHDGRTPTLEGEIESVSHLESSDLLVLDYHLDAGTGSEKAIDILRRLASNGNFNLVVVYTKDRDITGTGIDRTINEIALSLAAPSSKFEMNVARERAFEAKFESWDEIEEGIFGTLLDCIDEVAFLKILERDECQWTAVKDMPELEALSGWMDMIPKEVRITPDQVLALLMHKRQTMFKKNMSEHDFGRVTVGKKANLINWIRADSLFVTVVSKANAPSTIPEKLLDALEGWDPVPHRLIMSKMRNCLATEGVMAEASILRNRHLQAGWLAEILEIDNAKRRSSVRQNVARHWESLGGRIEPKILDFAGKIASHLSNETDQERLFTRFDKYGAFTQKIDVHLQMNVHACSKPVEGYHLSTGHVLRIGTEGSPYQYWLCLTPACDLEPGQNEMKGWSKRLGTWLPFKAVRLYSSDAPTALKAATRGYHLFFNEDGKTTIYGFTEVDNGSAHPTLSWEQFFVKDQGRFEGPHMLEVASIGKNRELAFDKKPALVVAQLRYEYALNLMQRLGSHLSRVGLDFSAYSPSDSSD